MWICKTSSAVLNPSGQKIRQKVGSCIMCMKLTALWLMNSSRLHAQKTSFTPTLLRRRIPNGIVMNQCSVICMTLFRQLGAMNLFLSFRWISTRTCLQSWEWSFRLSVWRVGMSEPHCSWRPFFFDNLCGKKSSGVILGQAFYALPEKTECISKHS